MPSPRPRNNGGFSFIELLAYMAIAALLILAAIPQFTSYRTKAVLSTMQGDAVALGQVIEGEFATEQAYPAVAALRTAEGDSASITVGDATQRLSDAGTSVAYAPSDTGFQLSLRNSKADGRVVNYDSTRGGLQRIGSEAVVDGADASAQRNLVVNSSFETPGNPAAGVYVMSTNGTGSVERSTAAAREGDYGMRVTRGDTYVFAALNDLTVKPGTTYTFSIYARGQQASTRMFIVDRGLAEGDSYRPKEYVISGSEWRRYEYVFTTSRTQTTASFSFGFEAWGATPGDALDFDQPMLNLTGKPGTYSKGPTS